MDGNSSESSRGGYRWRAPWMLPDEILYRCNDGYKKKIREMANAWNQTRWIKRLVVVVPSELEIIKQDFERRNVKLEKKIEQIE
ncbi:hypothetical protein Gotur_023807 [Gossypium turneri]